MKFLLGGLLIFLAVFAHSQNMYQYGDFRARTFDHNESKGGFQNWDVIQNNDGYIYVANTQGALEFNGNSWKLFEFENKEHPRSFDKNAKGDIFVGGINSFGRINYTDKGEVYIETLSEKLDSLDFKDLCVFV